MLDNESLEYFERREAEEREAASRAADDEARQIHLELADQYAAKAAEQRSTTTAGATAA